MLYSSNIFPPNFGVLWVSLDVNDEIHSELSKLNVDWMSKHIGSTVIIPLYVAKPVCRNVCIPPWSSALFDCMDSLLSAHDADSSIFKVQRFLTFISKGGYNVILDWMAFNTAHHQH